MIDKRVNTCYYGKSRKEIQMITSELLKLLKKNGCYLIRHGKNHDIWFSHKTDRQFAVPRHKDELKAGTLANIVRDAGLK